jgi:glutaryl-CoA dehydrogenase (non-decarboxylating)
MIITHLNRRLATLRLDDLREFELSEDQRAVRRMAEQFAQKELAPEVAGYEERGEWPADKVARMGELGFLGALIPTEWGGSGLDHVSYGLICEEVARADWVSASVISIQNSLVGSSILRFGTDEQRERFLRPLATGQAVASAGLTEPSGGSDLAALRTRASKDGGHYLLSGNKTFISHASHADTFLVLATVDPAAKHKGICAFIVEADTPNFEKRPLKLHGLRRGNTCELFFDDAPVPAENLLGAEREGFKVVTSALDLGRFSVAARCVGQAQACVDASLHYARERQQFGEEIGRFQMVQQLIADMVVAVEAARQLVYRVGRLKDAGVERASFEASMAKLFASDTAMRCVLDAIQVHGGYGLSAELPLGRYLQEAKVLQIGEGTNQLQRVLIAEYALGYRKM